MIPFALPKVKKQMDHRNEKIGKQIDLNPLNQYFVDFPEFFIF